MAGLIRLAIDHARWVIVIVLLLSVVAASQLVDWRHMELTLDIDPSMSELYSPGSAQRRNMDRLEAIFGNKKTVMVALYWDDLFTQAHLAEIDDATQAIKKVEHVASVFSLATVPRLAADGDALDMSPVAGPEGLNPNGARRIVQHNPLYESLLVSGEGNATVLYVNLRHGDAHKEDMSHVVADIRKAAQTATRQSTTIRMTGAPVVAVATQKAVFSELVQLIPLLLLAVTIFLVVAFRSVRGVLLPLLTIGIALLWVLGIMAAAGYSLNIITTIIPPVVITIGLAYVVHFLSGVYRWRMAAEPAREALSELALPLAMTVGTTIIGFLALLFSPLDAVQEFAWLTTLGVLFSGILVLVFLPAMLHVIGSRGLSAPPGMRIFEYMAKRLAHFDVTWRIPIIVASCVLVVVAGTGILFIDVGSNYIAGFKTHSPMRQDFEHISHDFGGVTTLSVVIQGDEAGTFAQPDKLRVLDELGDWLASQPAVGTVTALPEYLRVLNRALHGGSEQAFRIPQSVSAVRQFLLFGASDLQSSLVASNLQIARIRVRATVSGSSAINELVANIQKRLDALPDSLSGHVTGRPVLVASAVSDVANGQILTVGLAVLAVFTLLSVVFTSIRIGAVALLPNLIPVMVYFGTLGFTGINLNPTTSLIACIIVGIAVDDTIHYLSRFSHDVRRFASESRATLSTLQVVIRPATYTSLAMIMGFLMLSTSELNNQVQFGLLAAFACTISWLAYITVTPALGAEARIVTLWDMLRLDLGDNPQSSIPLFADLKLRHARIFALLTQIERFDVGGRVVSEGDDAGDMYVVIDGELRVVVSRDGREMEVAQLQRGEILGEVGHFGLRRSASVDAITPVRLLRFNADDLERMRRRYPRTAGLILRNLNRIQAQRLAETTKRLQ